MPTGSLARLAGLLDLLMLSIAILLTFGQSYTLVRVRFTAWRHSHHANPYGNDKALESAE